VVIGPDHWTLAEPARLFDRSLGPGRRRTRRTPRARLLDDTFDVR
jgi:hypothetical protein